MAKAPILIVRNPAAGRGAAARLWPQVASLLAESGLRHEVVDTDGGGHAARIAADAVLAGYEIVVAAGGDGTISEVAGAVAGSETAIAMLPFGTGNDLARHLGLADLGAAVAVLAAGKRRRVDVGKLDVGDLCCSFVNIAGTGFDAVVASRINKGFRRLKGTPAYVAAVLQTLATFRPAQLRVEVDGEVLDTRGMLCAIANASSYGGGMRVAPGACIDDGLFDIVIIGDVSRSDFLRTFPKVFSGKHLSHPKVIVKRGRQVTITAEPALPVLADGEVVGMTKASAEVQPGGLWLVAP